ncbi:S41 family peptidase [Candidatus Parcubacteria bacterium]|nr:S41 family peptidase [Candidatus Parcubacteria bacterium]
MSGFVRFKAVSFGLVILLVAGGAFAAGYAAKDAGIGSRAADAPDFSSLNNVYRVLQDKFDGQLDDAKLLDGAKAGLAAATGDPYTAYLNAEATKTLNDDLNGTISGIGAEVGLKSTRLVIVAPIADSPAAKAGLRPKDQIVLINGQDPTGLALDEAVGKIRGPEGSQVKLTIVRDGGAPFEVTITRAVITVASVKWEMKPHRIGYIQLTRFGPDTSAKMAEAARQLSGQGARRIVLDMRNNPGGYLDAAVNVAGEWLDGGVVVEQRRGERTISKLTATKGGQLVSVPTIVLINGGSASASEIVAGALQDHGAARVLGEKSYGKGSVQEVADLSGGANLKVTVAHWFTPKGKNINKEGIKPDVEVKLEAADYDAGRDPQLDRALELLK